MLNLQGILLTRESVILISGRAIKNTVPYSSHGRATRAIKQADKGDHESPYYRPHRAAKEACVCVCTVCSKEKTTSTSFCVAHLLSGHRTAYGFALRIISVSLFPFVVVVHSYLALTLGRIM